jgi:hypothetical protein
MMKLQIAFSLGRAPALFAEFKIPKKSKTEDHTAFPFKTEEAALGRTSMHKHLF